MGRRRCSTGKYTAYREQLPRLDRRSQTGGELPKGLA